MKSPLVRAAALLFVSSAGLGGFSASLAGGAEPTALNGVDPGRIQQERREGLAFVRQVERPSLIERLARTAEPVELEPRELAFLEAYLAANSRPRREPFDRFYSNRIALRGSSFDDPENRQVTASRNVSDDEWQRLRTHLLFNRLLVAQKAPNAVR